MRIVFIFYNAYFIRDRVSRGVSVFLSFLLLMFQIGFGNNYVYNSNSINIIRKTEIKSASRGFGVLGFWGFDTSVTD